MDTQRDTTMKNIICVGLTIAALCVVTVTLVILANTFFPSSSDEFGDDDSGEFSKNDKGPLPYDEEDKYKGIDKMKYDKEDSAETEIYGPDEQDKSDEDDTDEGTTKNEFDGDIYDIDHTETTTPIDSYEESDIHGSGDGKRGDTSIIDNDDDGSDDDDEAGILSGNTTANYEDETQDENYVFGDDSDYNKTQTTSGILSRRKTTAKYDYRWNEDNDTSSTTEKEYYTDGDITNVTDWGYGDENKNKTTEKSITQKTTTYDDFDYYDDGNINIDKYGEYDDNTEKTTTDRFDRKTTTRTYGWNEDNDTSSTTEKEYYTDGDITNVTDWGYGDENKNKTTEKSITQKTTTYDDFNDDDDDDDDYDDENRNFDKYGEYDDIKEKTTTNRFDRKTTTRIYGGFDVENKNTTGEYDTNTEPGAIDEYNTDGTDTTTDIYDAANKETPTNKYDKYDKAGAGIQTTTTEQHFENSSDTQDTTYYYIPYDNEQTTTDIYDDFNNTTPTDKYGKYDQFGANTQKTTTEKDFENRNDTQETTTEEDIENIEVFYKSANDNDDNADDEVDNTTSTTNLNNLDDDDDEEDEVEVTTISIKPKDSDDDDDDDDPLEEPKSTDIEESTTEIFDDGSHNTTTAKYDKYDKFSDDTKKTTTEENIQNSNDTQNTTTEEISEDALVLDKNADDKDDDDDDDEEMDGTTIGKNLKDNDNNKEEVEVTTISIKEKEYDDDDDDGDADDEEVNVTTVAKKLKDNEDEVEVTTISIKENKYYDDDDDDDDDDDEDPESLDLKAITTISNSTDQNEATTLLSEDQSQISESTTPLNDFDNTTENVMENPNETDETTTSSEINEKTTPMSTEPNKNETEDEITPIIPECILNNATDEENARNDSLPEPIKVCESEMCKRSASKMLSLMDHSQNPCQNFYKYACDGLDINRIGNYDYNAVILEKLKDFAPTGPETMQFKKLHDSCIYYSASEAKAKLNQHIYSIFINPEYDAENEKQSLTQLISSMLKWNPYGSRSRMLPLFDVKWDIDLNGNWIPTVTLPLELSPTAKLSGYDKYEAACLKQTQAFENIETDINLYKIFINCLSNQDLYMPAINTSIYELDLFESLSEIDKIQEVGKILDFVENEIFKQFGFMPRIKSDLLKLQESSVYMEYEELKSKFSSVDWAIIFSDLLNLTEGNITKVKVMYMDFLVKIFAFYENYEFSDIKNGLMAMTTHDLYMEFIESQNACDRRDLCLRLTTKTMEDITANLLLNEIQEAGLEFDSKIYTKIFEEIVFKTTKLVYHATDLDETKKDKILESLKQLEFVVDPDLTKLPQKYDNLKLTFTDFVENMLEIRKNNRLLKVQPDENTDIYTSNPLGIVIETNKGHNKIIMPPAMKAKYSHPKDQDYQSYEILATVGFQIAKAVNKFYYLNSLSETDNVEIASLKYEEHFDPRSYIIDYDNYRENHFTDDLPFLWLNFSIPQLFHLNLAQDYCRPHKDILENILDKMETEISPSNSRVDELMKQSHIFAETFNCRPDSTT